MSRCFPFPPPGYQKKLRVEDVAFLAKEKDKAIKEKRHKKEKGKERKDGREKSKERHKEKDKHKDKEKKTGKKRSWDEKNVKGDISKVEKVGSNSPQSSCAQELERRINLDGGTGNQSVHTVYNRDQGKDAQLVVVAKSGLDPNANGPSNHFQPKLPKIVFSNGAEQRTMQNGWPMENNINEPIHGNNIQKLHDSSRKGDKSKNRKNGMRHKGEVERCTLETFGYNSEQIDIPRETDFVHELERRVRDVNGATSQSYEWSKDDDRKRPRTEKSVKEESANVVKLSRIGQIGQNGGETTINSKQYTFKISDKTVEFTGEMKKLEADRYFHDSDMRPSKVQRTALFSQHSIENGKNLKSSTTITLSASKQVPPGGLKLDGEEHRSNWTVGGQSLPVPKKPSSCSLKHIVPTLGQSPFGPTKPSIAKAKEVVGIQGQPDQSPLGSTKPSIAKANGMVGIQGQSAQSPLGSTKPSISAKANGLVGIQRQPLRGGDNGVGPGQSPLGSTKPSIAKANGVVGIRGQPGQSLLGLTKPSISAKANGVVGIRGEPGQSFHGSTKPSTSAKANGVVDIQGQPSQPLLGSTKPFIPVKANGAVGVQGQPFGPTKPSLSIADVNGKTTSHESHLGSTKPSSSVGKINGTTSAHGSRTVTKKFMSQMKSPETVDCQESAKPPLTPRKVNLTMGPHGSPPISKTIPLMGKVPETVGYHESAKPPLMPGNIDGPLVPRGSPPVTNKPPSTSRKEKRKEKSSKPVTPHPDTKYLSQILSVPKLPELSEFGDSEWLFESKICSEQNAGCCRDGDEQVWAKAVHIESADIYALPYAIPY